MQINTISCVVRIVSIFYLWLVIFCKGSCCSAVKACTRAIVVTAVSPRSTGSNWKGIRPKLLSCFRKILIPHRRIEYVQDGQWGDIQIVGIL